MDLAVDREHLGEPLSGRARVDDHRAVVGYLADRLPPDAQLLRGVVHVSGVDHRLVVVALDRHRAAVDAPQQLTLLQVGQVTADRLGRDVEPAASSATSTEPCFSAKHVDLALAMVLERAGAAALGGRHRLPRSGAGERTVSRPSRRGVPLGDSLASVPERGAEPGLSRARREHVVEWRNRRGSSSGTTACAGRRHRCVEGLLLDGDDGQVPGPAGQGQRAAAIGPPCRGDASMVGMRNVGNLARAVDAQPGDLITHAGVREALQHRVDVLLARVAGDLASATGPPRGRAGRRGSRRTSGRPWPRRRT